MNTPSVPHQNTPEPQPRRRNLKVIVLATIAVISVTVASLVIYIFNKDKEIALLQDQTTVTSPVENQDTSVRRTYPVYTNPAMDMPPSEAATGNYYTAPKPKGSARNSYGADTSYYQGSYSSSYTSSGTTTAGTTSGNGSTPVENTETVRVNSSTAALGGSQGDSALRVNSSIDADRTALKKDKKKNRFKDKDGRSIYYEKVEVRDGQVNEVPVEDSETKTEENPGE